MGWLVLVVRRGVKRDQNKRRTNADAGACTHYQTAEHLQGIGLNVLLRWLATEGRLPDGR
jgi:hypothetical protein